MDEQAKKLTTTVYILKKRKKNTHCLKKAARDSIVIYLFLQCWMNSKSNIHKQVPSIWLKNRNEQLSILPDMETIQDFWESAVTTYL